MLSRKSLGSTKKTKKGRAGVGAAILLQKSKNVLPAGSRTSRPWDIRLFPGELFVNPEGRLLVFLGSVPTVNGGQGPANRRRLLTDFAKRFDAGQACCFIQ